jgi:hypothetical protein
VYTTIAIIAAMLVALWVVARLVLRWFVPQYARRRKQDQK